MIKYVSLILIFNVYAFTVFGQINVKGVVVSKHDKLSLPGVSILEKGTDNGTTTDINGNFSFSVSDSNAVLIVHFYGMVPREVNIGGKKYLKITLKSDCSIDTFDHQQIGMFLRSGVLNTPIGGQFDLSFPAFYRMTTLKTGLSYQTNLKNNDFLNAKVEFDHLILECDFQMDLKGFYKSISIGNDFDATIYSIETDLIIFDLHDLNIFDIGLVAGYSRLLDTNNETNDFQAFHGAQIGLVATLSRPLYSDFVAKMTLFQDSREYQVKLRSGYKRFVGFIEFYKLDSYNELSIGLGYNFTYRLKKQRK